MWNLSTVEHHNRILRNHLNEIERRLINESEPKRKFLEELNQRRKKN